MNVTKRFIVLIVIFLILTTSVGGTITYLLYQTALKQELLSLAEIAKSQVQLIEAVARFDATHSKKDHPEGASGATLSQIKDAYINKGFSESGEFEVAQRQGNKIVYLYTPRSSISQKLEAIPWDSELGQPMRQALSGFSGTTIALDYRRQEVLAAFEPIKALNVGIVAKKDLAEFRHPFLETALIASIVSLLLIGIGTYLLLHTSEPIVASLKQNEEELRMIFDNAAVGILQASLDGKFLKVNPKLSEIWGYSETELLHMSFKDVTFPEDLEKTKTQLNQILSGATQSFSLEKRYVKKDGNVLWGRVNVSQASNQQYLLAAVEDISQLKAAEERQKHLVSILEATPDFVGFASSDGTIHYINPAGREILGITKDEDLKQYNIMEFHPDWVKDEFKHILPRVIDKGSWTGEGAFKTKNGREIPVSMVISSHQSPQEKTTYLSTLSRDITDRQQADQALKQNEAKLRSILDSAVDSIVTINSQGIIDSVNPATEKIFGYPEGEMLGKNVSILIPNPHQGKHGQYISSYQKTGIKKIIGKGREVKGKRSDGSTFPLHLSISEAQFGKESRYIGIMRDISDLKQTEKNLQLFSDAIETSKDAFNITDTEGVIIYSNNASEKMFGYRKGELLGKPFDIFDTEEQFLAKRVIPTMQKYSSWSGEVSQKRKDQTTFPVSLTMTLIKNSQKEVIGMLGIAHDITLRKRINNELKMAKEQADAANQAKSMFLANMSHEIRTPLNSIVGFSQILLSHQEQHILPDSFKQYLQNIQLSSESLSELINNILDLSKIEAGKLDMLEEDLNFQQLFQGIYHINKAAAIEKKLDYTYHFDAKLPKFIHSDRSKLNQILMNLVANAIKFTPNNKKVTLKAGLDDDHLFIQVIDEGIGISEEQQKVIFNSFEQADGSTTRVFGGTGLGLSITKKMAEMLGGTISVESVPNQGSTFSVRLPYKKAENQERTALSTHSDTYHFSEDNVILVVEDNPMNQEMIKAILNNVGLQSFFEENGEAGINRALSLAEEGHPPDLIFMDMHMPGMDGMATTEKLREYPELAEIPIVALSAHAFKEQQKSAFAKGIQDYLTKPINLNRLHGILNKYLHQLPPASTVSEEIPLSVDETDVSFSMPDTIEQQILEEWKNFSKYPIFYVDEIIEQVETIIKLCDGFDSPYSSTAKEILDATYAGDEDRYTSLIESPPA